MKNLPHLLLDICLLRAGPQDMPATHLVLALAVCGYIGVGVLLAVPNYPLGQALLWSVLDTAVLAALARTSLRWRGYPHRFPQTFSALAGTGALLSLVSWPLMWWVSGVPEGDAAALLPSVLLALLLLWSIAVIAHILRHALASSYAAGVVLALLYVMISWNLSSVLFPPPN